jgi:PAS domain S-box-containing protein
VTPDAGEAGWSSLFWVAFERSGNSMLLLQPDRVIVAVNQACAEWLGYFPEELIGRRSDSLVTPDGWRQVDSDWAALQRTGDLFVERALVRADERHVEVHLAAAGPLS